MSRASCRFVLWAYAEPNVLPRNLQTLLVGSQVVGFATLLRSVAYDRWITVLASLLLVVGATAALRGRTWGVALSFASAVAFPVAWAIGIAPIWFVSVGVIGALPFLMASSALAKVDRQATALLAVLAAGGGTLAAIVWKAVAWETFRAFPALSPSGLPNHGVLVTALLTFAMVTIAMGSRASRESKPVTAPERVRIGALGTSTEREAAAECESEAEADGEARATLRSKHL